VKPGQPAEIALDLYPGQIWRGKVEMIWQGSGAGQLLPSGTLPNFSYVPSEIPQGQFAAVISLEGADQTQPGRPPGLPVGHELAGKPDRLRSRSDPSPAAAGRQPDSAAPRAWRQLRL
jgi:hypothetical protein